MLQAPEVMALSVLVRPGKTITGGHLRDCIKENVAKLKTSCTSWETSTSSRRSLSTAPSTVLLPASNWELIRINRDSKRTMNQKKKCAENLAHWRLMFKSCNNLHQCSLFFNTLNGCGFWHIPIFHKIGG